MTFCLNLDFLTQFNYIHVNCVCVARRSIFQRQMNSFKVMRSKLDLAAPIERRALQMSADA